MILVNDKPIEKQYQFNRSYNLFLGATKHGSIWIILLPFSRNTFIMLPQSDSTEFFLEYTKETKLISLNTKHKCKID